VKQVALADRLLITKTDLPEATAVPALTARLAELNPGAQVLTVAHGEVTRVDRKIPEQNAYGEYIGVAKFSPAGAERLHEYYERRRNEFAGKRWRDARDFEKAYKILLFQDMIEQGERFSHVDTPGGYIEVDTQQDFEYARQHWVSKHLLR